MRKALLLAALLAAPLGAAPGTIIASEKQALKHLGKPVRIQGKAINAKLAAAVQGKSLLVYHIDLGEWPANVEGKQVTLEGTLQREGAMTTKSPEISAGTDQPVWVIHKATYTLKR